MDFAALGIKIDSSQAKQAFADLEKLADAGAAADKAVTGVGGAGKKAALGLADADKAAKSASKSIDDYVQKLQLTAKTNGMGAREAKLYELALQGASAAQLKAADSAIRMNDAYLRGVEIGRQIKVGLIAIAAAAGAAATGAYVAANRIAESIAKYQDLADKTGETAQNIASLQTASDLSGVSLDTVASASVRLTAALSKTDDESKLVAKGIKALGLNFDEFKRMTPAQQLDTLAQSFGKFEDGAEKSAVAVAILGRSGAEMLPFFNDLAEGGERQVRLTEEQIRAADDYTKAMAGLKSQISEVAQRIVADSIPALTELAKITKDAIAEALDLDTTASSLGRNVSFQTFAENAGRALARMIDYVAQSVRELKVLVDFVGSSAEALKAYGSGDFAGGRQIAQGFRDRYGLDEWGRKVGKGTADAAGKSFLTEFEEAITRNRNDRNRSLLNAVEHGRTGPTRPRLNASGLNMDRGKNTSAQEARAQLAYDLEDIRNAQEKLTNTIVNGEKILEAKRQANLITEKDYWEQKRQFLIDNQKAEEDGLQKQIARLEQEKLTGKAKIDNDRKILDLEAKLEKSRANGAANLEVLSVKQTDALDRIRIKFEEAAKAAQTYVDTIAKQNQRELDGLGKGNLQREIDSRRSQREDQFLARKDQLDSQRRASQITSEEYEKYLAIEQDAFNKSIKLDEEYWAKKKEIREDGLKGAQEALQNYIDEIDNAYERSSKLFSEGLDSLTDGLTGLLTGDKGQSLKDFGKKFVDQITKGIVEQQFTKPIAQWLQNQLSDPESGLGGFFGGLLGGNKDGSTLLGDLLGVGGSKTGSNARGSSMGNPLYVKSVDSLLGSGGTGSSSGSGGGLLGSLIGAAASAFGGLSNSTAGTLANALPGDSLDNLFKLTGGWNGWAEGGYTGSGGKHEIAGAVHRGEYVVNAEATRALGLSFLERLNRAGHGYANGGYARNVAAGNLQAPSSSTYHYSPSINVNGDMDKRTAIQLNNRLSREQRIAQARMR